VNADPLGGEEGAEAVVGRRRGEGSLLIDCFNRAGDGGTGVPLLWGISDCLSVF